MIQGSRSKITSDLGPLLKGRERAWRSGHGQPREVLLKGMAQYDWPPCTS